MDICGKRMQAPGIRRNRARHSRDALSRGGNRPRRSTEVAIAGSGAPCRAPGSKWPIPPHLHDRVWLLPSSGGALHPSKTFMIRSGKIHTADNPIAGKSPGILGNKSIAYMSIRRCLSLDSQEAHARARLSLACVVDAGTSSSIASADPRATVVAPVAASFSSSGRERPPERQAEPRSDTRLRTEKARSSSGLRASPRPGPGGTVIIPSLTSGRAVTRSRYQLR